MAITETINPPLTLTRMVTISHIDTGTVAARKFTTGFRPRYVKVVNETDRIQMEWFEGMANLEGLLQVANGDKTLVTADGITPAADGFTLGLNTTLYISGKQYSMIVLG